MSKILMIDDESILLGIMHKLLEKKFEVVSYTNACHAMDHLKMGATYDAIVCDILMPDCSGVDLYHEMEKYRPELCRKIIFMTGGSLIPGVASFLSSIKAFSIEKPFHIEDLEKIMAKIVNHE